MYDYNTNAGIKRTIFILRIYVLIYSIIYLIMNMSNLYLLNFNYKIAHINESMINFLVR